MTWQAVLRDRRLWLVLAAAMALAGLWLSGLTSYLSLDALRAHRSVLTAWVAAQPVVAGAAYVVGYAVAVAFSVPGATLLTLAGGFLFGAVTGTALAVCGATLGATGVFLFARTLFGANVLDRLGAQAQRLAVAIRANAASYLLVLRLVPLFPFFLVNLVPAFVGVPVGTFLITTFFGIIPGAAVFALAGSGMGEVLDRGGAITPGSILTPQIMAGLVGLAVLSLAAIPVRRWLESRTKSTAPDPRP